MPPVAVQLSYRLGGNDGVAVEARKWEWALQELGFTVRRVAGEIDDASRPDDHELPFLEIDPTDDVVLSPDELTVAIAGADLVIVENLCSLPAQLRRGGAHGDGALRTRRTGRVPPPRPAVATRRAADTTEHPAAPAEFAARHDQRPLTLCSSNAAASRPSRCATPSISIPPAVTATERVLRSASRGATSSSCNRPVRSRARTSPLRWPSPPRSPAPPRPRRSPVDHRSRRRRLRRRARPAYRRLRGSGHDRAGGQRRGRLRRRRSRAVPVDVGGLREPGDRVDRAPSTHRRGQLPRSRRAPSVRGATAVGGPPRGRRGLAARTRSECARAQRGARSSALLPAGSSPTPRRARSPRQDGPTW